MKTRPLSVMIRIFSFCLLFTVLLSSLTGCSAGEEPGKHNVVKDFGYVNASEVKVCELAGHEDRIAELSQMALIVRDVKPDYEKSFNEDGRLRFSFTAVVEEIVMDLTGGLKAGDEIRFLSYNGYCPVPTAKKLLGSAPFSQEDEKSGENAEIVSYIEGALPIEAGGTYLLYLTVREDGSLSEGGRNFVYQLCGDCVYTGCDRKPAEYSAKELTEHVRDVTDHRTGIADEIGAVEYLKRCGAEDFAAIAE